VSKKIYNDKRLSLIIETTNGGICEFSINNEKIYYDTFGLVLSNKKSKSHAILNDNSSLDCIKGNIISIKYVCDGNLPSHLTQFMEKNDRFMRSYFNEITTTEGSFYVGIFNEHNGYYPHDYCISWKNINGIEDYINRDVF